ncbi:MAG: ribosomal protein S18-alanine N-acetyltransferase [Spirochaetia bacterium]|nr:ribosomal protein S18-alanine N-acetyltransferase [Spirochaetia bacterium]
MAKDIIEHDIQKTFFRNASELDIQNLLEIEEDSFTNSRLKKRQFLYLVKHGKCDFIICEYDKKVAGYAISQFRKNSTEARIYSIAIHSQYRKKGFGIALLKEICSCAVQRGCKSIRLEMDISNEAGKNFYKKMGFNENGKIFNYYGNNKDAVRFKKIL